MRSSAEKSSSSATNAAQLSRQPFITPAVQRKMTLSKPGDKLEQEADRIADRVMRMPDAVKGPEELPRQADERLQGAAAPPRPGPAMEPEKLAGKEEVRLQRAGQPEEKLERAKEPDEKLRLQGDEKLRLSGDERLRLDGDDKLRPKESDTATTVEPGVESAVRGATGGESLSSGTRSFMESRFGADFGGVRVHNDEEAARLGDRLSARAFTYRNHVFFARDQYRPESGEGRRLLAHELSHTVQQGHGIARQGNPPEKREERPEIGRAAAKTKAQPAKEEPTSSEVVAISGDELAPSPKVSGEIEARKHKGLEVRVMVKGVTGEGRVKVRADRKKKFDSMGRGTIPLLNAWTDRLGGLHINFNVTNSKITNGYASFKPKGGDRNDWLQAVRKNPELLGAVGLKVENLPRPVNKFEAGTLTLGVSNLKVEIGGFLAAAFNVTVENAGTPKVEATADLDVKGMVKGQLKLDNKKERLAGEVMLGVDFKAFSGSALVRLNPDGSVDIGGKAAYNSDKLSGQVNFLATDMEGANKFAKEAIAAAGGKENIEAAGPPPPVPAPKEGKKKRALAATGLLEFQVSRWFAGSVWVVVDGKGNLTVVSKIAPPAEIPLFDEKNFDREIIDFTAKAYYGIPVVGNLNLFATIRLTALARLGPAKVYRIEILGTYSTDPEIQKSIRISGSVNVSAYGGLRLRAEGGAGVEIASHDLKFGVGVQADIGVKAYAEARPTVGYRDPGEFFVSGTLEIVAQPMFALGGDFFIALETPWWSPLSDDRWTWPLFTKEWPLGDPVGINAVVKEYVLGSGKVPEIELKKPEFDPSKFMTSMVDDELPNKSGGKGAGGGTFKDDGSIPKAEIPPKKPEPKKAEAKAPKKGAPPRKGKSAKPDPKGAKELQTGKIFQAAAKPLAALKEKGPFTRAMLNRELGSIKGSVKGIDFDLAIKGDDWVVTPKAAGKRGKGLALKGKDLDKEAAVDGKKDGRSVEQMKKDEEAAIKEANGLLEDENKDAPEIEKALPLIRTKYKLTTLVLIVTPIDVDEVFYSFRATINPATTGPKKRRLRKHKSQYVTRKGNKYMLKSGFDTKEVIRDKFYGKSYRDKVYTWRDKEVNGPLAHPTNPKLYKWNNKWWDKTKAYDEAPTVDHKTQPVVEHWNEQGRKTDQQERKDYFNDTKGCEVVPYRENSSMGAQLKGSYMKRVTINFRGPGD